MSDDPQNSDSLTAVTPESNPYPPPVRRRPPMPKPPVLESPAPPEPASDGAVGVDDQEVFSLADFEWDGEFETQPSSATSTEPEGPEPTPPRTLPVMVFKSPLNEEDAPKKSRSAMSTLVALLGVVTGVGLGVLGFGALTGASETSVLQSQLTSSAEVGQCYSDQVRFVDCDSPHTYEVFGTNQLPERSDYPGVVSRSLGSETCSIIFFNYTGREQIESTSAIYSVYPTDAQWAEGERWELCVLSDESLRPLVGSAAASIS